MAGNYRYYIVTIANVKVGGIDYAANEEVSRKLLSNMSARMAQNIRDALEITTNARMKDVENATMTTLAERAYGGQDER